MNLFYIARKNLSAKPLQTTLSIILLAFGIGMSSLMILTEKQIQDQFDRNLKDIDLVLGAKGSGLQSILANVYHIDAPLGNISLDAANEILKNPHIESGIPLAYGDSYMSYRIVGTEHSYPEHYEVDIEEGRLWEDTYEVTIGKEVASDLGLKLGDTFFSSHGLLDKQDAIDDTLAIHKNAEFVVVGIFKESSSVIDQLILTRVESIWAIHGDYGDDPDKPREITAMLLKKRNNLAVLTLPNILRETNMQVALPAIEINRLNDRFSVGIKAINAIAFLIVILSFASIFISVFESMQTRKYELALMRTMGGSSGSLYKLIILEGGLLSTMGAITGLVFSRICLLILSSAMQDKFKYSIDHMSLVMWDISETLNYICLKFKFLCSICDKINELRQFVNIEYYSPEVLIVFCAIFVGISASVIPAWGTLNRDISRTLSED